MESYSNERFAAPSPNVPGFQKNPDGHRHFPFRDEIIEYNQDALVSFFIRSRRRLETPSLTAGLEASY